MAWRIKPILVGEFGMVRDDIKFYNGDPNISGMVPSYSFLLDNGDSQIIVDTGFGSPQKCEERLGLIVKREKDIKALMEGAGVNFDRVDTVILTHLHWDHASNINLFPRCPIYCQENEISYAFAPNSDYDPYFLEELCNNWDRVISLDGPTQLMEGIRIVLVGGHSYGSQAVVVSTLEGEVVITGDTVMTYANLEKNIPIGLCVNVTECRAALDWIHSEKLEILPSHDYMTIERSYKFQ